MTVFYLTLLTVFIFALLARFSATPNPIGPVYRLPNRYFTFVVISIMVLVSGLRNNIGDTYFYIYSYETQRFTLETVFEAKDFGFNVLQYLLQKLSTDSQLLIFSVSLVTNVLILYVLWNYSRMFELSVYLFITTGQYLVSMNGIRQFLAAAFLFWATRYLFSGNWFKYLIVLVLAATIHQSALIMFPIYFLVRRKAWTKETYLLLAIAVVFVAGFGFFSQALFTAIQNTKYAEYQNLETNGANYLRAIIAAVPLVLAYIGRDKLRSIFPKIDYIVNMSLLNVVVMFIATQQWIFARFSIYFGLYSLILIPWLVKAFVPKQQKLVYYGIILFYFIYFVYEQAVSLNIYYSSRYFHL